MACDRDQLMRDIRSGARLRPTKTVDKSKPILLVEGESLKLIAPLQQQNGCSPAPPPPPPPPPPPGAPPFSSATLPKQSSNGHKDAGDSKTQNSTGSPGDRDALMQAIRQGVTLRKVKNGFTEPKKFENHEPPKSDQTEKSITKQIVAPSNSYNAEEPCVVKKIPELTQIRPSLIKQNYFYQNGKSQDSADSSTPSFKPNRRDSTSKPTFSENGNGHHEPGHHVTKRSPTSETVPVSTEKRNSIHDAVANFEKRISPESSTPEKRFLTEMNFPDKRSVNHTISNFEKRNITETVSNFEKRGAISDTSNSDNHTSTIEKRVRPQKLPLGAARSSSSSSENRTPESNRNGSSEIHAIRNGDFVKNGPENTGDQKADFALSGFVNGAKAIWEKRRSIDDTSSPQHQPTTKSNLAPVLRFFNGPDYPEPAPPGAPIPAPVPQSMPIAIETNLPNGMESSMRKSNSEYCLQQDDSLPKVDHLRRAYEKSDPKSIDPNATLRRQPQQPKNGPATAVIQRQHHRSESLDSGDRSEQAHVSQKSDHPTVVSKQPARFLPDVGALKQRFEEKAIEERSRITKPPPVVPAQTSQSQTGSTTSAASSGYSSGSPSPKSAENGPKTTQPTQNSNRFQFHQPTQNGTSTLPHDRHRNRSGSQPEIQKSIQSIQQGKKRSNVDDGAMKGCYVANNPNSETVGPFKASMATLGGDDGGMVKKNRNYYKTAADAAANNHHAHQNGNANDTATWIVKKGSVPNIVTKYAVCEHLEALHQRKVTSSNATNGNSSSGDSSSSSQAKSATDELLDGEVARLLGIPFDKLKELRFDIDVNDPEGSLLRIQKRYNEVS